MQSKQQISTKTWNSGQWKPTIYVSYNTGWLKHIAMPLLFPPSYSWTKSFSFLSSAADF